MPIIPQESVVHWYVDSIREDFQLDQKISKRRFFQDIKDSFQWVIGNGLKPTQFFLFKIYQQIRSLEKFKVLAEMGRGWQADWAVTKIFVPI